MDHGFWQRVLSSPLVCLVLLFVPSLVAVTQANALANTLYDPLASALARSLDKLAILPTPFAEILGGDYGVVAMIPFLLLYALPTIVFFSLLIMLYTSTGLMDRIACGTHPYVRPFGLGARDLTRVVMGFGCNVPAVVSTWSCSSCSRHLRIGDFIRFGLLLSIARDSRCIRSGGNDLAWRDLPFGPRGR